MNDPKYIDSEAAKGYVYSKEDLAIDWRDVEKHAARAKEAGWEVEMRLVKGAGHVVLFKGEEGEKGYWGFVEGVVRRGMGSE